MMQVLQAAAKDSITVPGNFNPGNGSALQVLQMLKEYPTAFKGPRGRKRAGAALMALQRAGRITVETYRDHNRNTKTRVVLTRTYQEELLAELGADAENLCFSS